MSIIDVLTLAASGFVDGFTLEQLAVAAWKLDKSKFGLRGFERDHPDATKVKLYIVGRNGTVAKGLMERATGKRLKLTANGRFRSQSLVIRDYKVTEDDHERFNAIRARHPNGEPTFAEALQFWGVGADGSIMDAIGDVTATLSIFAAVGDALDAAYAMEALSVSASLMKKYKSHIAITDMKRKRKSGARS